MSADIVCLLLRGPLCSPRSIFKKETIDRQQAVSLQLHCNYIVRGGNFVTSLVQVGNSYGVRIPKALILQAHLGGRPLELKVVKNGLLISPVNEARAGWKEAVEKILRDHPEAGGDRAWLDAPLNSADKELEW